MNKYSLNKKGKIVGTNLNRLEKKVVSICNDEDDPMLFIQDVLYGGCQSGIVGELIYYTDTVRWFKLYRQEIESQVKQMQEELGMNLNELNGWDADDPFAREQYNQNLLAWFSFETVCSEIQNCLEV